MLVSSHFSFGSISFVVQNKNLNTSLNLCQLNCNLVLQYDSKGLLLAAENPFCFYEMVIGSCNRGNTKMNPEKSQIP
jgi:hypothetical protein